MAKFSWKDAPDLMAELAACQNHPFNANRDIMTFAGFAESRDELALYVAQHEMAIQNAEQDREFDARRVA